MLKYPHYHDWPYFACISIVLPISINLFKKLKSNEKWQTGLQKGTTVMGMTNGDLGVLTTKALRAASGFLDHLSEA